MPRKERHVVPNSDRGGWDTKRENAERASKHFETKKDAIDWSRPKAKQEGSELIPTSDETKTTSYTNPLEFQHYGLR